MFRDDFLNGLQVTEFIWFCDGPSSRKNKSKSINATVDLLVLCMLSNAEWYSYIQYKFIKAILKCFQETEGK